MSCGFAQMDFDDYRGTVTMGWRVFIVGSSVIRLSRLETRGPVLHARLDFGFLGGKSGFWWLWGWKINPVTYLVASKGETYRVDGF